MDLRVRLGIGDARVLAALKAMETHIEAPISRERLAQLAGMSLRQLERFKNQTGRGMRGHYLAMRLNRSRQLLRETSLSILEIALQTGFASASQFSRAFARAFEHSPREIQKPFCTIHARHDRHQGT